MELLYVWIKEYKNIENQGFNFSPKWRFDYDPKTGKLEVEDRREKVIDNFFGEHISNVTAIVGENGSGKSSLLEFIFENIAHNISEMPVEECLVVSESSDRLQILFTETLKVKYGALNRKIRDKKIKIIHPNPERESYSDYGFDTDIIYYTNLLDFARFNSSGQNLSTAHLIKHDFDRLENLESVSFEVNNVDKIDAFILHENRRQLKFAIEFMDSDIVPFRLPKTARLFLGIYKMEIDSELNSFGQDLGLVNSAFKKFRRIIGEIKGKELFLNLLAINAFYFYVAERSLLDVDFERVKKELGKFLKSGGSIISLVQEIFDWSYFDDFLSNCEREISEDMITVVEKKVASDIFIDFDSSNFTSLSSILKAYDTVLHLLPNLFFSWGGISSGEKSLLNLYSRFFDKSLHESWSSCVILLDEASLSFHPKWQSSFLKTFIDIIYETIYSGLTEYSTPKIQIILTSHSPFVLSGLPKENVIFLKKGEDGKCQVADGLNEMKQTFGANIHTLLSDSFFMDGLMGDFAKGKIDKVIRFLNGDLKTGETMSEDEAEKIINMIGEPILKRHLQQQMDFTKKKKADKNEERIKNLEMEIEELKKQIGK